MNKRISVWLTVITLCAALVLPEFSVGSPAQVAAAGPKADVTQSVHHALSKPLRDIQPAKSAVAAGTQVEAPIGYLPPVGGPGAGGKADPTLQSPTKGRKVGTTPGIDFDGTSACGGGASCYIPPDTDGAVGATQYVQWVNAAFAVYNKTTGAIAAGFPKPGNALWTGFGGGCEANNNGDPIALYDHLANRWFLTQFSVTNPATFHYLQCVAVSTTSDATGSYNLYSFDYGPTAFNDYGKVGIWPDGYYITYNIFNGKPDAPNGPLSTFGGAKACVFDRTAMVAGAGTATQQCFDLGTSYGGVLPSDLDGATPPPAGSPNFLLNFGSNSLNLWKFHVDWTTPANTTLTGPTTIPVAAFSEACSGGTCIPQPGTVQTLDSLADRLMYRLAYRNFGSRESLVVNHSVVAGTTPSAVRWYELQNPNGAVTVAQAGTVGGDGTSRWMGSIAMDKAGDMALGYSASSTTLLPSIAYTGRLASDAPGTMQAEALIKAGSGSQVVGTGTRHRWGDYSAMSVDPVDDCTFWYTQEYLPATGEFNWNTHIASFKFPSCGGSGPPPTPTGLHASSATTSSVTFSWTNADPTANVTVSDGTTATPLAAGTTSFTRTGVPLGSYVCLSISAWNAGGSSAWSPFTCGLTVPLMPTSLHVSGATNTGVSFAWTDSDSHSAIALGIGTTGGATYTGLVPGTTTSTKAVAAGFWACAQVAAYNTSYASAFSPWTCGLAVPNAPTAIHVTGHTVNSVSFGWTDGDPYSGIAVSNGSTVSTVAAGGTTYTQGGMATNSWVCVSLAAYNSSGASAWSASLTGWVCGQAT